MSGKRYILAIFLAVHFPSPSSLMDPFVDLSGVTPSVSTDTTAHQESTLSSVFESVSVWLNGCETASHPSVDSVEQRDKYSKFSQDVAKQGFNFGFSF